MHSRTLHRHLQAFGTRFRDLVEEERFAIARQMLEDSSMDVCQIADLLAYADASAFTKAFRRWSGTTPTQWRLGAASRCRTGNKPAWPALKQAPLVDGKSDGWSQLRGTIVAIVYLFSNSRSNLLKPVPS